MGKIIDNAYIIFRRLISYLPPKMAYSFLYFLNHKKTMNWNNPQTYDEKMMYLMTYCFNNKNIAKYADKLAVRDYIKDKGYEDLLPEIYGIWEKAEDINFDILPNQFVIKTNNGCGSNYIEICLNKNKIDKQKIINKFKKALKYEFWRYHNEQHYKYIKPRVYAEEYLNDNLQDRMTDYKVHCFNGKAEAILVCKNRSSSLSLNYFDLNWNNLDITNSNIQFDHPIKKPASLNKMIKVAEDLSSIFPCARVDFYDINGKLMFGEITLTPAGGYLYYINNKWQKIFGDKIKLPNK